MEELDQRVRDDEQREQQQQLHHVEVRERHRRVEKVERRARVGAEAEGHVTKRAEHGTHRHVVAQRSLPLAAPLAAHAQQDVLDLCESPAHRQKGLEAAVCAQPADLVAREKVARSDGAPLVVGDSLAGDAILVDLIAAEQRVVHLQRTKHEPQHIPLGGEVEVGELEFDQGGPLHDAAVQPDAVPVQLKVTSVCAQNGEGWQVVRTPSSRRESARRAY